MGPRYFIGIDLHKSVIRACVLDGEGCGGPATLRASRFQPNKIAFNRLRYSSACFCRILRNGQEGRKAALKAAESPSTTASIYGSPDRGSPNCRRGSTPHKSRVADQSNGPESICTTPSQGRFLAGFGSGSGLNPGLEVFGSRLPRRPQLNEPQRIGENPITAQSRWTTTAQQCHPRHAGADSLEQRKCLIYGGELDIYKDAFFGSTGSCLSLQVLEGGHRGLGIRRDRARQWTGG